MPSLLKLIVHLIITALIKINIYANVVVIDHFNLHKYNLNNDWQYVQNKFKAGPVQQIAIIGSIIQVQGLRKIFEYDIKNLKVFNITNCILNPKTINFILEQDFVYNLETLVLNNCNLQCKDFELIKQKQSKIKKLNLANNRISYKGFQYISKAKMNLQSLDLYGNSLLYNRSVNALIQMNLSNIRQINVGKTAISQQNLLRILNSIDKQKLVNLTIRQNRYNQLFYQQFTKLSFPKLQYINMYALIVDDDSWKYFQNFILPQCKVFNIHQNQITTNMAMKVITKKNFPKLQTLDLNLNFVNSTFIRHLRQQNFTFKQLKFRTFSMNSLGLQQLSLMDLSKLQYFDYSFSVTTPQIVQQFFSKANLTSLKQLHMPVLYNAGNILTHIFNANLPNLQYLRITHIEQFDKSLLKKTNTLSKVLGHRQRIVAEIRLEYSGSSTITLIIYIQDIFTQFFIERILNGGLNYRVHKPLQITINSITNVIVSGAPVLTIVVQQNKKPKFKYLNHDLLATQLFQKNIQEGKISSRKQLLLSAVNEFNRQLMQKYFNSFDFSQIGTLQESSDFKFLKMYTDVNKKCIFKNLSSIHMNNLTDYNLQIIQKCQYPNLRIVTLDFLQSKVADSQQMSDDSEDSQSTNKFIQEIQTRNFTFPLFQHVEILIISHMNNVSLINSLRKNKLQYLVTLDISQLKLKPFDLQQVIKSIPYFSRLKVLDVSDNYINSNISVLTTAQTKLQQLILQNIILSENKNSYKDLCLLNFEFASNLVFSKIGIDDQFMIKFIQCLKNKVNQTQVVFPKLDNIDLSQNYLQTKGISAFMKINLPLITSVDFQENKDPQYFNTVFHQPSSKRLMNFYSFRNYFSGIDHNFEPFVSNTKRLQTFLLQSNDIKSADIKILSNYQFDSLDRFITLVKKVNGCQTLKDLLKISKSSKQILLQIMEPQSGLNSSCIEQELISESSPDKIQIVIGNHYGQVRRFAQYYVGQAKNVKNIVLINTFISDQVLLKMFQREKKISKIQVLFLENNNISDISVQQILQKQYKMLKVLSIGNNERITSKSMKGMKNFTYNNLVQLDISSTSIDDEGINYLVHNKFPMLASINLANTDITKDGLLLLNTLKAPNLQILDLSCNSLSVDDLAQLQVDNFPLLKVVRIYPSLSDQQHLRLQHKYNRNLKDRKAQQKQDKIIIQTVVWYEQIEKLQLDQ